MGVCFHRIACLASWFLLLAVLLAARSAWGREWTSRSGDKKLQAELVAVKEGRAYLETKDGKVVRIALDNLSDDDVLFLARRPEHRSEVLKLRPDLKAKIQAAAAPPFGPNPVGSFKLNQSGIEALSFTPDSAFLVVAGPTSLTPVINLAKNSASYIPVPDGQISYQVLRIGPDGRRLLMSGYADKVDVWELKPDGQLALTRSLEGHKYSVKLIEISTDGQYALTADDDKSVIYWKIDTGQPLFKISDLDERVHALRISRHRKQAVICQEKRALLIDLETGEIGQAMSYPAGFARFSRRVFISPNGRHLTTVDNRTVNRLDLVTGEQLPNLTSDNSVRVCAYSHTGKYLYLAGSRSLSVWDTNSNRPRLAYNVPDGAFIRQLACSPDGQWVAVAAGSKEILVYKAPPP